MKKTNIIILIFITLISIFTVCVCRYKNNALFKGKNERSINISYEKIQNDIDNEIKKYASNKEITIDSPKIIVNPYNNSPLTALIIFYTDYSTSIKLYINDIYMTTIESSKSHIIPVYGLRENYNNKIVIVDEKETKKELYIVTNKIDNNSFYNYKTKFDENSQLFLNSSRGKYAIDNNGYISWFMNINTLKMNISENKVIYMNDIYGNLVETDFMGRIYKKYYSNTNFDDHYIKVLDNGNIMGIINYNIISILDYKTGEYKDIVDVCEILKKIDNDIIIEPSNFYLNYFQYNDKDNTILLSIRGLNCIIYYDLNKNEIIWIFSNNSIISNKFNKYKLKLINGEYVTGQHTPYLVGNCLYVFNNGIFKDGTIGTYNEETSFPVIYEINGMEIKEVYRYGSTYLSGWYGSFYEKDNIKNINYGCIINNDKGKYSKVIEVDKDDNIISDFSTNFNSTLIYQSHRNTFYEEITPNYDLNVKYETIINNIDNVKHDINLYEVNYYKSANYFKKNIKSSMIDETLIMLNNDVLETNVSQEFELLFVDKNYNHYNMIINNGDTVIGIQDLFFSNIRGKYAIYIKFNNKYYDTNLVLNIT